MRDNKHKIFEHGECISEDVLIAYANNTLSAKEKHVVEKHTLGCDMCADALEGIMIMRNPSQLKGITESLNKRIGGTGTERKPIVLWMDTRVRVAIAAGLALLIGFFFLFNNTLNESADNKTVSDNLKQNEGAMDSTSMSLEEGKKTDSVFSLHQDVATGKELDAKNKPSEKTGEVVTFTDANGGPGNNWTATSHASGGDELKSPKDQREEDKKFLAPAPPPKDAQQNGLSGFNDVTTSDRSKSVDDKKGDGQTEKKPNADVKDKEEKDDENNVNRKVTVTSNVSSNESINNISNNGNAKTDAPKKEEKEKIVSKNSGKKSKNKSSAYPEVNQPDEKSNKGGKDQLEDQVQSQTVVTGGTSGTTSPNMVPQTTKTEQEVTLSKNKEVSFDADGSYRNDTMKFKTALDSTTKYGYYGVGEVSGNGKYADKDYSGAVIIFSKTLETKPADREALYKLGDSYLQLNKPDLAIVQFDKLITMGKGVYYDAARYDKSQALIKQKKNAEAKKLLMEIEQTSTEYKSRAKVDLDKIK